MQWGDGRLPDRFWSKVVPEPNSGCWLWSASLHRQGYGMIGVGSINRLAHDFAFEALVGPVGDGLELDHKCRTPSCCNPDHLEPVTHTENVRRGSRRNQRCSCGREYDVIKTSGNRTHRRCSECRRAYMRSYMKTWLANRKASGKVAV